jgi:predicted metalloprotease with PDZ domain
MMKFTYSFRKPGNHFLWVKLEIDNSVGNDLILNLPVWRPGRYEFGNFAKNLRDFTVKDSNGNTLNYSKKQKKLGLLNPKMQNKSLLSILFMRIHSTQVQPI